MSIYEPSRSPWSGRMLGIFRIVAGFMFITAGTMKLFNWPANPMPGMPRVEWWSQMGIGGMLEVVGGVAIVLGLFTRPVAFVLAGEMAVAYFQFHAPGGFFPTSNMGVPAVMYCFFFLYLVFEGAGPWSLDAVIARTRGETDHARQPHSGPRAPLLRRLPGRGPGRDGGAARPGVHVHQPV
ncbi:MAG TPA: DoxX family protein [Longimicrobium sp.]|nr:DoxX family protein [Longimicrobium sp.]